jgi:hypothetical protein
VPGSRRCRQHRWTACGAGRRRPKARPALSIGRTSDIPHRAGGADRIRRPPAAPGRRSCPCNPQASMAGSRLGLGQGLQSARLQPQVLADHVMAARASRQATPPLALEMEDLASLLDQIAQYPLLTILRQRSSAAYRCLCTRHACAPPYSCMVGEWLGRSPRAAPADAELLRQNTVTRRRLAQAGSCQSSQVQRARPMTSSLSCAGSHGSSSVNSVTHCRQEQGMRVISVPQNTRSGPKAS